VQTTAPDALFSQGSIAIFGDYLFVVNAGSDSLSLFAINPIDATQLTLISVQPTYGQFPTSVAVNSKYACVLTTGTITGIRCFMYGPLGLVVIPWFDRDLTWVISQSTPPKGPTGTFSEIIFSADDRSLIISAKGPNTKSKGYLLFYQLSYDWTDLSLKPTVHSPPSTILPFSLTLIGTDGLLVTDPGSKGVLTHTYSSTTGEISNSVFTPIDRSIVDALCWSAYSPTIGNYYAIGSKPPGIVELNVNLKNTLNPVQIIRYYTFPNGTGALDTTVVTVTGTDYLFVLGSAKQWIYSFRLDGPGKAVPIQVVTTPQASIVGVPKITGIAAYVQGHSWPSRRFHW